MQALPEGLKHWKSGLGYAYEDPAFSPTVTLKNVSIDLDDFDVFWMGGRIQF